MPDNLIPFYWGRGATWQGSDRDTQTYYFWMVNHSDWHEMGETLKSATENVIQKIRRFSTYREVKFNQKPSDEWGKDTIFIPEDILLATPNDLIE